MKKYLSFVKFEHILFALPLVFAGAFLAAHGLAASASQAARLLSQGAVEVGGQTLREREASVPYGAVVRVGRRRFFRVAKG